MTSIETNHEDAATLDRLARHVALAASEDAVDTLPSTGLLSFYDRLRARIVRTLERRGGKLGPRVASALLLVPDVFILVLRLAIDKEVPRPSRVLLASTLAYFVLPIDLMPEGVIGPAGYLDDLVIALAVLSQTFGKELKPYAEKYWSGSEALRPVLGDVLGSANSLLGSTVYGRVRGLLEKKGVAFAPSPEAAEAHPEPA